MTKKTRLIILACCAVLFLIITPYILLYSVGYRIDFLHLKIVGTGGIYVKALPEGATITIDSHNNTTGFLSSYVFKQNLLPGSHSIAIQKNGYYNYQKNLQVQENQVTKLEHVILFKKNIAFEKLPKGTLFPPVAKEAYVIKNNSLYSAANVQAQLAAPIIKNIAAFATLNGNIIYLGLDGFLYQYTTGNQKTTAITAKAFPVNKKNSYAITATLQIITLQENESLFLLNKTNLNFENIYSPVTAVKISPGGQNMLLYNDHEILYARLDNVKNTVFLNRFSEKITDCYWLNDEYIIFVLGGKINISEIDIRGNINIVTLPQTILLAGQTMSLQNPEIFFNQQDKKLYILNQNSLIASERLIP